MKLFILFTFILAICYSCKKYDETVVYSSSFDQVDKWKLEEINTSETQANAKIENGNLVLYSKGGIARATLDFTELMTSYDNADIIMVEIVFDYFSSSLLYSGTSIIGIDKEVYIYHKGKKYQALKTLFADKQRVEYRISENKCEVSINGKIQNSAYETVESNKAGSIIEIQVVSNPNSQSSFLEETIVASSIEITVFNQK